MIFLTVGAQMPFDRLVQAVDRWAGAGPGREVFAQIGDTDFRPSHMVYRASLEPREFAETVQRCRVIVAHAGMGSILSALRAGKPILIFPRRGDLRETRNDHQVATARQMRGRPGVKIALDEAELLTELDRLTATATPTPIQPWASDDLINRIRCFIWSGTRPIGPSLADETNRSGSPTLSDHPHHGIETP